MVIRRLQKEDLEAAVAVARQALPIPSEFDPGDRAEWLERRTAHMAATDPAGAWVAEEDGAVVGMTLAIVRDGIWGLSVMAVQPDRHGRGTGRQLLEAALRHAEGTRGGIILSSVDPRAMRMYARAGFDLRPTVALAGIADRDAIPGGLLAMPTADVEACAALGRPVRGGAYGAADIELMLTRPAVGALLVEGRGFAVHEEGSPILLAARDEEAATDLLWSCLAAAPRGGSVHVDFLTAGQDWAVRACLDARLILSPDGPVYTRGELGPMRPWIPSGAIL